MSFWEFFIVLLVLAIPVAVIFLISKYNDLALRINSLESFLLRLQQQIAELKQSKPPRESAGTVETLVSSRRAPPAPATPIVPPPLSVEPPPARAPIVQTTQATQPIKPPPLIISARPESTPEAPPIATPEPEATRLNLEQFLGAKLFAWIGGFALFLGIAFFVKYSFEHNLIPPWVRVALGAASGMGLIVGGLLMRRKEYAVTSQTLCATGVVALYASSFAAHSVYHLIGSIPAFLLMSLVTAAAFTLAVRTNALVIAILGLVAGFLTPPLLSTGEDNPGGLFGYVGLLDIGLVAVAFRQQWHFLTILGALGTVLMEFAWVIKFFAPLKISIALAIFL
jgi:uncharacterized membrane protein